MKKPRVNILFEDEHLLVLDKPAGLVTIPDRYGADNENLFGLMQRSYDPLYVVHRLDRQTSGVICFARSADAHRKLSLQFENHSVDKFYHALLSGILHHEEGEIDKPIGHHPSQAGKMVISMAGKPSLTFFRVLERFRQYTLAEALLKTGRTHQVRVHFQSLGFPLAVDPMYGTRDGLYLSEIKGKSYKGGKADEPERPLIGRNTLHASRIRIDHPASGERLEFKSELPKDFSAVLNQLRKWGR